MRTRPSPSFVVAVLALVVASGGAGYAAGTVTSSQIADNTIQSRDIKNGAVEGVDVASRSLARTKISKGCASGEVAVFGGCVTKASKGPTSYQAAMDDCNQRNGRLPTTAEYAWIRSHTEFAWADGNPSQYEFSGDYTGQFPYTPIAFDRAGNSIDNASAMLFWHHCVTS
jgi:hypothetical protein